MSTRDSLADKRTDLAEARTVLAVERTFSAWIKTSIGFLAGGLGLTKLMSAQLTGVHGVAILSSSALLVVVAMVITGYASWRYRQRMQQLDTERLGRWPVRIVLFVSVSFILVCLVGLVCLWVIP